MLVFDPNHPYPRIPEGAYDLRPSLKEAQTHSEQVDTWLGLQTQSIETRLRDQATGASASNQELWIGLPVQSLLTPYTEIREILELLAPAPGTHVVDLGAGYGRMGFVMGRHFPEVTFTGYEFVAERVEEANRCLVPWNYSQVRILPADLSDPGFQPAPADFYFLYDFGSRAAVEKTLEDLKSIARTRSITVVGRGRRSRDAIERRHPWLSGVVAPQHHGTFSIYRSA